MHLYLQKFSASGGVIRKPPLVPDLGATRGGFLITGGFLKWNSPDNNTFYESALIGFIFSFLREKIHSSSKLLTD